MPKSSPSANPIPNITLVGMPNVGKSSLFNCLAPKQKKYQRALTGETEGLTRDVRTAELCTITTIPYRLADTAGCPYKGKADPIALQAWQQTRQILQESDGAVFLIDGRHPLGAGDQDILTFLRHLAIPTLILANKCEGKNRQAITLWDDNDFGDPIPISCSHRMNIHVMDEWISQQFSSHHAASPPLLDDSPFVITIIGKPNVGKSTLANQLIGSDVMLVNDIAHTTRDAIPHSIPFPRKDTIPWLLYDTAGLTRKKHSLHNIPQVRAQTIDAITQSHLALIMLDARYPPSKQDFSIADVAISHNTTPLVILNKSDLIGAKAKHIILMQYREMAEARMAQIGKLHLVALSAMKGTGIAQLNRLILIIRDKMQRQLTTPHLNKFLSHIQQNHPPPRGKTGAVKIRYMTQTSHNPPEFTLFANKPNEIHESYRRYVMHQLRKKFNCEGIPIQLIWRKSMTRWNERNQK